MTGKKNCYYLRQLKQEKKKAGGRNREFGSRLVKSQMLISYPEGQGNSGVGCGYS